jgi:E3 ubiquitin-protein ligase MUL1
VRRLSELSDAALPLLVAVRGRADAVEPVACEHASGVAAVLYESAVEQQFLKQTDAGEWVRDAALVAHVLKEAPWFLDDGSKARVWVVGGAGASGLRLATVHDSFEPSARGVVKSSWEFLRGLKALGTRTTERALPVGTPLTAIGQAVRAEDGTLQLRRPPSGRPFYVSTKTMEQLLDSLGAAARLFRVLSLGCTAAGVAMLLARAMQHLRAKRRAAAMRRRVEEAAAARRAAAAAGGGGGGAAGGAGDADEDAAQEEVPASQLCVICLERQHDVVFRDCGHLAACHTCAARLTKVRLGARVATVRSCGANPPPLSHRAAQCPICRRTGPIIRVYRA